MEEVAAVKTQGQLDQIETLLRDRDAIYGDVWRFGLNSALRISDILALQMKEFRNLDDDSPMLKLRERKTGKNKSILLNAGAMAVVRRRLQEHSTDYWAFQSTSPKHRRDQPKAINRRSIGRVLHHIGMQVNPSVQLGTHSMRKTRGSFLFASGCSIERICKVMNHSSPAVTMKYIGLDQSDIDSTYTELVL